MRRGSVNLRPLVATLGCFIFSSFAAAAVHLDWDRKTLVLVQRGGGYPRMARIADGLLCCFEHRGECYVRKSVDEGKTWQDSTRVVGYEFGSAANPELLVCRDGRVMLFFNGRPHDGKHPFTIGMAVSQDRGATWTPAAKPLYVAGNGPNTGCYEPSALQLPSGEIQLFFANELPYKHGDQEITLTRSSDDGKTWTAPQTVSFRRGGRDGMPVPLILQNGKGLALVIEDNGLAGDHQLKPAIVHSPTPTAWTGPAASGASRRRWAAVSTPFPHGTYAGAPYFRQLLTGETILSCQNGDSRGLQQMLVYVGDADAKHFGDPTEPFPTDTGMRSMWNSLFVKNRTTVTALSSATVDGVSGTWAIDAHVNRD